MVQSFSFSHDNFICSPFVPHPSNLPPLSLMTPSQHIMSPFRLVLLLVSEDLNTDHLTLP